MLRSDPTIIVRRRPLRNAFFPSLMLIGMVSVRPVTAAVFTVGSDGACTHSTIASALLSAALAGGPDEIRLARNQTYTNQYLHLTNWDPDTTGALTISGGFATCSDLDTFGETVISGQAGNPTVEVDTTSAFDSVVTLSRLELTGSGSRGLSVACCADVKVYSSVIENNAGGVEVVDASLELAFTTVRNNTGGVTQGGGVRCDNSLLTFADTVISGNTATNGGGLFAAACPMTVRGSLTFDVNQAQRGGGIYADTLSTLSVNQAFNVGWVKVTNNQASDSGGGLYATASSELTLINPIITGNQAASVGGGIYASGGAAVTLSPVGAGFAEQDNCPQFEDACVALSRNQLTTGVLGSAAYVTSDADLLVYRGFVEENFDAFGTGLALYATGSGSSIIMEGVQLWNNRTNALWYATNSATVRAAFVSAARNNWNTPAVASSGAVISGGANFQLFSSALWDITAFDTASAGTVTADCVIAESTAGISISYSSTQNPLFRNPAAGDLHLSPESPAVDYCDALVYPPLFADIDGEARGYDHEGNLNGSPGVGGGTYDLGYDEVLHLFQDGFESGDTSGWSVTVP